MEQNNKDFDAAFGLFMEIIKKNSDAYMTARFPTLPKCNFTAEPGSKYIRVVKSYNDNTGRSVFCFVNKKTGDVLKAATWKAPAKHVRGTIYDINNYGVNEHGANYIR
jgi:hypothetical protein